MLLKSLGKLDIKFHLKMALAALYLDHFNMDLQHFLFNFKF